jgi:hypothetical protein
VPTTSIEEQTMKQICHSLVALCLGGGVATVVAAKPPQRAPEPAFERVECEREVAREPAPRAAPAARPRRREGETVPAISATPLPEAFEVQCACVSMRGIA